VSVEDGKEESSEAETSCKKGKSGSGGLRRHVLEEQKIEEDDEIG